MDRERERAKERIIRYLQKWGYQHLELAYHAAFPLALTPELLYLIRENFLPDCPIVAVADLLLSPLCLTVGEALYEIRAIERDILLRQLAIDARFGEERLRELADFMAAYIETKLPENPKIARDLGTDHRWIALAYIRPGSADRLREEIARLLEKTERKEDIYRRVAAFLDDSEDLLRAAGLEPLVEDTRWETIAGMPLQTFSIDTVTLDFPKEPPKLKFETVSVDITGKIIKKETREAYYYEEALGEGIEPLMMIAIPAGEFQMGSPGEKDDHGREKPQHLVKVSAFYLSQTPITRAQWRFVANLPREGRDLKPDPSRFKEGENYPVEGVSWYDAIEFCARLSRYTGGEYRLPSEAEWEYACRSGTTTPFYFGETITGELANYNSSVVYQQETAKKSIGKTTPVRYYPPNAFGLYDMHGNVREWCLDPWHGDYKDAPTDGSVWDENDNDNRYQNIVDNINVLLENKRPRVRRGGCWNVDPRNCRSAFRNFFAPVNDLNVIGFRVVRVPPRVP